MSAAYQLPWEFQLSGSFLAQPGPSVAANYTVTAALAGRPIVGTTAGATTIAVNLIEPNTVFLDYQKKLDLRLGRTFRFGSRNRIQGFADVFNVLNAGTVVRINETFGANPATNAWRTTHGDHGSALHALRHADVVLRETATEDSEDTELILSKCRHTVATAPPAI